MSGKHLRLPAISLDHTLVLGLIAGTTLFALLKPISAIDLTVFLRMGAWIAEHGQILETEPFAQGALGTIFQNGTWLAQWTLYQIHRVGGYPGLQGALAISVLTTLAISTRLLVARSGWKLAPLGILLTLAFLVQNLAIRPQTFSPPLFVLVYLLLDQYPERRFTPPILAGITALWTNLHGAFPIAFALPGAFWLEDILANRRGHIPRLLRPHRWIFLGVVMLLATFLNPYGPSIYRYILENSALPVQRGLSEWLAPDPTSFLGARFYAVFVVVLVLGIKSRAHVRLSDLLLLIAFSILAIRSQRMIVWWGIILAPIATRWIAQQCPHLTQARAPQTLHTILGWGMVAFWILLFSTNLPGRKGPEIDDRGDYPGLDKDTPVEAATYLETAAGHTITPGKLFHRLEWGSYFMWRLWPEYQTFIDIRVWIFSDQVWEEYLSASRGEKGWRALLERHDIRTMILCPKTQSGLLEAALSDEHWREVHRDKVAVVLERVERR